MKASLLTIFLATFALIIPQSVYAESLLSPKIHAQPSAKAARAYPPMLRLSEFMPNPPVGENEWVEIYNPSNREWDISGFKLDDIEGGSLPYVIPEGTKIAPKGYLVFYFSSPKLNNDGDTIRLICPGGRILDSYAYTKTTRGASYAKDGQGAWFLTQTPTPGGPNIITPL